MAGAMNRIEYIARQWKAYPTVALRATQNVALRAIQYVALRAT